MASSALHPHVTCCRHPLLQHNLAILRDSNTAHERFRNAIRKVSLFVLYEATRDLPLTKAYVDTPVAKAEAQILAPDIPVILTPILRAGLIMAEVALELLPGASVYHVGLYRDEATLKPVTYYNKLPSTIDYSQARIFVLDPMLATGGSAVAAVDIIRQLGVREENMTFACVIAAPEGIANLTRHYPNVRIVAGAIDDGLNDKAYIVPGLGDAGDRTFGTV